MPVKPTTLPLWATTGGTTLEPSGGQKAAGFAVSTKPPARWVNWLYNNLYTWMQYLDAPVGTGAGAAISGTGGTTSGSGLKGTGGAPNGKGLEGVGTGSGAGVQGTGGATGVGVAGVGGSSSGAGVTGIGTAGNARGVQGTGQGTGAGVFGTGGATGQGGTFTGGATSGTGATGSGGTGGGVGLAGTGTGGFAGVTGQGQGAGAGVTGTGGATGIGVVGTGAGGAAGGSFTGQGGGAGVAGQGGATGAGVTGTGGATSGAGGVFTGGTNYPGVTATGNGSGGGLVGTGGASDGTGVTGVGGATNGTGVHGQATGTGDGVNAIASSSTTSRAIWGVHVTAGGVAIRGENQAAGTGTGAGVHGIALGGNYGVIAEGDASTPAKAALRIVPQNLAPSSPVEGDVYTDSVLHRKLYYDGSKWAGAWRVGAITAASAARTSTGQFDQTISIPALSMQVGTVLKIVAGFNLSATSGAGVGFDVRLGGSVIATSATISNVGDSVAVIYVSIDGPLGASNVWRCVSHFITTENPTGNTPFGGADARTITKTTAGANTVDASFNVFSGTGTATLQYLSVEVLS